MHAFELQRLIDRFLAETNSFNTFFDVVIELATLADTMKPYLENIALGGGKQTEGAIHINALLTNTRQATSKVNQRQFFRALERFQLELSMLKPVDTPESSLIEELEVDVESFADLYDVFLSKGTASSALPVMLAATVLRIKARSLILSLEMFRGFIGANDLARESEASLALWLPAQFDLGNFAQRLLALQSIYSEICMLFSISESDHPLRISKIESGSLWAKLFGESRVIEMMTSFIRNTVAWTYRSYTEEGKISAIPRKVDAVDALLGLTARLKQEGINTSEIELNIQKAAVAISKDLTTLLDGQSAVTLNEETISVGTELHKALLEKATIPKLSSYSVADHETPLLLTNTPKPD